MEFDSCVGSILYSVQPDKYFQDFKFRRALLLTVTCREQDGARRGTRRGASAITTTINTSPLVDLKRDESVNTLIADTDV